MKSLPLSERALEIRCTAGSPHPLDTPSVLSNEDAKQGIVIEVVDSGHGIDSGLVDQVMSPFFSTKKDGMGMGLAICHSILSAHDGQITFRNNLSQPGTTFRLFLPRSNQGSSP
jgi:signal transduction histidine kinase